MSLKLNEEGVFNRQERIEWWDQQKLSDAKVMVVGAGAIGNEVLKNLALLGVGYILVVDFDEIEKSNLSRTVLFRKEDLGGKKAEIAAKRTAELALADNFSIDWFHGDAIWELGTGIFKEMDLVLGCLDNVETRFEVNRACRIAGVPLIDAGIRELDGSVSCYSPSQNICYACTSTRMLSAEKKNRYSCDEFKRKMFNEGKIATVQISAARVAAIQVQEAIQFLHGDEHNAGHKLLYQGRLDVFERICLPENPNCFVHQIEPSEDVLSTSFPVTKTLLEFLTLLEQSPYDLTNPRLVIKWEKWRFLKGIKTSNGFKAIDLPHFKIYQEEIDAWTKDEETWEIQELDTFSLEDSDESILNKTLHELGVPFGHLVLIEGDNKSAQTIQLDAGEIMKSK